MKLTTLMTTVAVTALMASSAMAQGPMQGHRDMQGASEQSPSGMEQGAGRTRGSTRDTRPSAQTRERSTTGQGTTSSESSERGAGAGGGDDFSRDRRPDSRATQSHDQQRRNTTMDNRSRSSEQRQRSMSDQRALQQRSGENQRNNRPVSSRNERSGLARQNTAESKDRLRQTRQNAARDTERSEQTRQHTARGSDRAPNLTTQQRTRFASVFSRQRVEPVTHVDFSLRVGIAVPSRVHLSPVPAEIVEFVPQYRGYDYFVTVDRIVIVEPRTHEIVYVMPYEHRSRTIASSTRHREHVSLTSAQRNIVRANAYPIRHETTGSVVTREVTIEEEVPASVELEEFDEPVVRAIPSFRHYRYYRDNDDIVVVNPEDRRVIDVVR